MYTPDLPIKTDRLILRPFREGDVHDVFAYLSRPDVVRYLYWTERTRDDIRLMIERRRKDIAFTEEGTAVKLAVELFETGRVIGDVLLAWSSLQHHQGEIGYVFHPDFGGYGYATEAVRVMVDMGFRHLDLHRVYGRCDARNERSFRLMERLGMRREAYFRNNEFVKGEWTDELIYAMLREEWREQTKKETR